MKTGFEEEINKNGYFVYTSKGTSMLPLIRQNRDLLIIEKPVGRLKRFDVPLYKRDNEEKGRYVLHRIIKVREDDYVIRGDNCYGNEYGITDKNIIGVLKKIIRNGKEISVDDPGLCLIPQRVCVKTTDRSLKTSDQEG